MAATPVVPLPGNVSIVTTGNTPVTVIAVGPEGGFITNPANPVDQGLSVAESLFVDPTGADPTLQANGTTFEIPPGGSWPVIPGQTTVTKVNAASPGHKFSAIQLQLA